MVDSDRRTGPGVNVGVGGGGICAIGGGICWFCAVFCAGGGELGGGSARLLCWVCSGGAARSILARWSGHGSGGKLGIGGSNEKPAKIPRLTRLVGLGSGRGAGATGLGPGGPFVSFSPDGGGASGGSFVMTLDLFNCS